MKTGRILSDGEVTLLNLSRGKTYGLWFLFNDKRNNAGLPGPFQLAGASLDKIAKSFHGRPLLLPPAGIEDSHFSTIGSNLTDLNAILEHQKRHAIGEIVTHIKNPSTNNVYAVVDIFPEFIEDAKNHRLPKHTSPLLTNDRTEHGLTLEARGIHLQLVNSPGYPPQIAKLHALCEGGLNECMREMRVLGATNKLREFQKSFFNTQNQQSKSIMDTQSKSNKSDTERIADLENTIRKIPTQITEIKQSVESIKGLIGAQGEVVTEVKQHDPVTNDIKSIEEHPVVKDLQKKIQDLEADNKKKAEELAAEKERIAKENRERQIQEIVSAELLLKEIPLSKKDEQIKMYRESEGDLTLLHKKMTERAAKIKIIGASGNRSFAVLEDTQASEINYLQSYIENFPRMGV